MRSWLIYILLISFIGIANATDYRFRHMTTDDGLTHNQVNDIYQDAHGFVWLSTAWGLNIYDGYKFKTFLSAEDSTTLKSNFVNWARDISRDRMLVHTSAGNCIYDRTTDKFSYDVSMYMPEGSYELDIRTYVDCHYNVWVAYKDALYVSLGSETELKMVIPSVPHKGDITGITENNDRVVYAMWSGQVGSIDISMLDPDTKTVNSEVVSGVMPLGRNLPYIDEDGEFWFSNRDVHGVWRYSPRTNKWVEYNNSPNSEVKVPEVMVRNIIQDRQGIIWIATDHGGLVLYDKKTGTTNNLRHNHNDYYSILEDATNCISIDRDGTMWLGYYQAGLSYYNPSNFKFGVDRFDDMVDVDPSFVPNITCVEHDENGNIWLGTNGCGLLRIDAKTGEKRRYRHDDRNSNSLPSDVIVALKCASDGNLWIGTFMGGLSVFDGKTFTNYIHNQKVPSSVSCTSIWSIDESDDGKIWIGSLNSGMASYDIKTKVFKGFTRVQDGILSDYVADLIYSETNKCLYIASQKGISVMSLGANEQGVNYAVRELDPENRYPLLHEHIHQLVEDSRGLLWVGTRTGLCVYDPILNVSSTFKLHVDGTNDYVTAIAEDDKHDLWVATSDGLVNIKVENASGLQGEKYKYVLSKYTKEDGLENGVYNERAIHSLPDGRVFVGRSFGLSVFDPNILSFNQEPPQVTYTSLKLYGEEVRPQQVLYGARPLDTQLYLTEEGISVPSKISMITVGFSTLNYIMSQKTTYTYRLDGMGEGSKTTTKPEATFTNLLPGTYTLYVSATNADGFSNHYEYPLKIKVLPPWYASKIAFVVYVLLFVFAVWCLVQLLMYYMQTRKGNGLTMTPEMQRKILNEHKEQFFNSVAQELNTPLNAIFPSLEKLKRDPNITGDSVGQLALVDKNVKLLQKTLNSIVGLQELGAGNAELVAVRADLVLHLKQIYKAFEGHNTQDLEYTFQSSQPNIMMDFDADKITTAVSNLLSNASKFTPDFGQIALSIEAYPDYVKINVTDTGVGISDKHKALIFNKYYQVNSGSTTGYGLGLHVTKEIVQMHNGTIEVKDNPSGVGTQFTITLPYVQSNAKSAVQEEDKGQEKEVQAVAQTTKVDEQLMENIKSYVLEHILSEITVDDLARHLRSSKVQLYKKTMQATNMSPVEYIRHIRLAEAAKLLTESMSPVKDVATATGFAMVDYFEQYFIEEYGMHPSEYQQRYNKEAK